MAMRRTIVPGLHRLPLVPLLLPPPPRGGVRGVGAGDESPLAAMVMVQVNDHCHHYLSLACIGNWPRYRTRQLDSLIYEPGAFY